MTERRELGLTDAERDTGGATAKEDERSGHAEESEQGYDRQRLRLSYDVSVLGWRAGRWLCPQCTWLVAHGHAIGC